MSIIKSKQAGNFTVLSNDIFKSGLSIEAIGLLAYFLSLPHDWVIYKTKLHTQLNIGREKLDRVFKELQDSGYILSVKRQQESGRFEHEHIVYDKPYNGEPASGEPDTALPPLANQPLLKKEDTKETIQKKKKKKKLSQHELTPEVMGMVPPEHVHTFMFWMLYKEKRCEFYTEEGIKILISKIKPLTPAQFSYVCDISVMNNWSGLFFERVTEMPVVQKSTGYESKFKHEQW